MSTIIVENLGKAYKQYPTRWSRLVEWLSLGKKVHHKLKWVMQDVSFMVHPGEAVGIIGINGAGKSTLLKMITGTTRPTTGAVNMSGRVAALLELGMGFHPEFTGRQNAFMAGQLLGYSVDEIARLMPEIEAFAEIGEYIDQPVRVYSSGMQVRLAFSVATAIRPDILIVDEALSVGDAYFQHKSFERIKRLRAAGTTLLIVSHDKGAIQAICDKAILLNRGMLEMIGPPEQVLDFYNALLATNDSKSIKQLEVSGGKKITNSGTKEMVIETVFLSNLSGQHIELVGVGEKIFLNIKTRACSNINQLVVGYMIKDRLGQEVFGTNTFHMDRLVKNIISGDVILFKFSFEANLGEGNYSIAVALHETDNHVMKTYEWRDLALIFQVVNKSHQKFIGVAWAPPEVEINYE